MSRWYRAGYQERIDTAFVRHAAPGDVAAWFSANWKSPSSIFALLDGVIGQVLDGAALADENGRRLLEYVAVRRQHPLIDVAVARYGFSRRSIQRAYDRANPSVSAAALINVRGGMRLRQAREVLHGATVHPFSALLSGDGLRDRDIEELLAGSGIAEGLEGGRYLAAIHLLSNNPKLRAC